MRGGGKDRRSRLVPPARPQPVSHGLAKGVAFSPDGRFLALGGVEPDLVIFDLVSGGLRRLRDPPSRQTQALAFSPDGRTLAATTSRSGDIILWDLAVDRVRMTLQGHSPVLCLAFSPDGRTLAVGERDEKTVSLWDLETGLCRLLPRPPIGVASSVAFSPDGSLVAASSPARAHGLDLGPEDRSVVPSDRGTCRRHQLSRFLPGWKNPGHGGQ